VVRGSAFTNHYGRVGFSFRRLNSTYAGGLLIRYNNVNEIDRNYSTLASLVRRAKATVVTRQLSVVTRRVAHYRGPFDNTVVTYD